MAERPAAGFWWLVHRSRPRLPLWTLRNARHFSGRAESEGLRVAARQGSPRTHPSGHRRPWAAHRASDAPHRPPLHPRSHETRSSLRARCGSQGTMGARPRMVGEGGCRIGSAEPRADPEWSRQV